MAAGRHWWRILWVAALCITGCVTTTQEDKSGPGHVPPPSAPPAPPMPEEKPKPLEPQPLPPPFTGSYQDRIERALREHVGNSGVQVLRKSNGDGLRIIVPANSAFMLNSEQIQPYFAPVLDGIAQVLREYDRTSISVQGYTDPTGSFEHNQQLSERRAQSVAGYLIKKQVAAPRVRSAGYGPRFPMVPNDSDAGRSRNRRVEIVVTPLP